MNSSELPYLYSYSTSHRLDCSSGYESASNDSSLMELYFTSPSLMIRNEQQSVIKDDQIDREEELTDCDGNECHPKRRVLSRSQREEANRRERHRMKIINQAYERLRNALPLKKGRKRQKMSRMDTVDGAIQYIGLLLEQLDGKHSF